MRYQELIKKVQVYSGFSDTESKDALDCLVESLAVRLDDHDRLYFASQLPEELQSMALSVYPTEQNSQQDILEQFMEFQHVKESRAKRQIYSAWQALKDNLSFKEIEAIRGQLPNQLNHILR